MREAPRGKACAKAPLPGELAEFTRPEGLCSLAITAHIKKGGPHEKTHPPHPRRRPHPCRLCICHGHSVHPSRKLDPGTDRSNYPCPNHSPLLPGGQLVQQWRHLLCLCPRGKDSLLLKTDYAAATQTVNCAVPGCAHDSDACPAYFTDDPGRNLVITDDPLRVCHVEDRDCPVQIYTVDPAAGKAMQEINGVGNCDIAYCDGTALYGIDKTVLPSEATPACRIDLASGQLDRFTMLPSELMLAAMTTAC